MLSFGIDQLNIYASTQQVDLREVARRRAISEKDLRLVRFESRSVLPLFEDPVTLAVNAARPLLDAGAARDVDLLIVATETGLDYGKPLSTYVQEALGLGPRCRNFEIKHACFGGTAALQTAVSHVRSARPGARALVIMSDIARCHLGEVAEITAGAAAVALLISANPRIAAVSSMSGLSSKEVFDVARPSATTEYNDPVLSLYSYLDLVEGAWSHYRELAGVTDLSPHFRYMLYHAPLISLVERAHRALLELASDDLTVEVEKASFDRMVAPSLRYNRVLGNVYSGSLYASLAGLIEDPDADLDGARIGAFSYGSGACSELLALEIMPTARATLAQQRIAAHLAERRAVSVDDYEQQIQELQRAMPLPDFEPLVRVHGSLHDDLYAGRGRLVLERVQNHRRRYRWS